jgi:hypothetical protein
VPPRWGIAGHGSPDLVQYAVFGGPVDVNQRLTVFEDGFVELRHRRRDTVTLSIDSRQIDAIRSGLARIPKRRGLARGRPRWRWTSVGYGVITLDHGPHRPPGDTYFQLTWRKRRVRGSEALDPSLTEVLALLDEIRLRAIRSQPR